MFYRIRQFIKAIFAKITPEDQVFYETYLTPSERRLFQKLKRADQKHVIGVARTLEEMTKGDVEMIRVGLLHDIGKSVYPLSPIEKGIMVILNKLLGSRVRKWDQFRMVKGYYGHPRAGYELLKESGNYREDFLAMIRDHHQKEIDSLKLKQLKQADDLN